MKAISALILSILHVQLIGAQIEGVPVRLELYHYVLHEEYVEVQVWYSEDCVTDATGRCTFEIGETETGLRGRLWVGEAWRDVIWPGGELTLSLDVTAVAAGESAPYDFQEEPDVPVVVHRAGRAWAPVAIVLLILVWCFVVIWIYKQSFPKS